MSTATSSTPSTPATLKVAVTGWWGDCSVKIDDQSLLGRLKRTVVNDARQQMLIAAIDSRNAQPHIAVTTKSRPQDPVALNWITDLPYTLRREGLRVATADTIEITFGSNVILPEVHFTVVHIPGLREKHLAAVTKILDDAWEMFFNSEGDYWLSNKDREWMDALVIEDETKKVKREKREKKVREPRARRESPARVDHAELSALRTELAMQRGEISALRSEISSIRNEISSMRASQWKPARHDPPNPFAPFGPTFGSGTSAFGKSDTGFGSGFGSRA
jgi:hypothetical protein